MAKYLALLAVGLVLLFGFQDVTAEIEAIKEAEKEAAAKQ